MNKYHQTTGKKKLQALCKKRVEKLNETLFGNNCINWNMALLANIESSSWTTEPLVKLIEFDFHSIHFNAYPK